MGMIGQSGGAGSTDALGKNRMTPIALLEGMFAFLTLGLISIATVDSNPIIAQKATIGLIFLTGPFFAAWVITEIRGQWRPVNFRNVKLQGLILAVALIGIGTLFIGQTLVTQSIGQLGAVDVLGSKGFYSSMGIAETFTFQYFILNSFLLALSALKFWGELLANVATCFIAVLYHIPVYGSLGKYVTLFGVFSIYSNAALVAVFASFFILNGFYLYGTGGKLHYIDVPATIHGMFNFFLA